MGTARLLAALAIAAPALAFEIERGEGGATIRWNDARVFYAIEPGPGDDAAAAVRTAFATWDALGPEIDFAEDEPASTTDPDAVSGDGRTSVLWPSRWDRDPAVLAHTLIRHGAGDVIVEADIMLNPDVRWTVIDGPGADAGGQDVQNTVTHEIGHLLGLGHSDVAEATMFATTPPGETAKRDLADDDVDGYLFLYAGLDAEGDGGAWAGGCGAAPARAASGAPWAVALLGAAHAFRRRRRWRESPDVISGSRR